MTLTSPTSPHVVILSSDPWLSMIYKRALEEKALSVSALDSFDDLFITLKIHKPKVFLFHWPSLTENIFKSLMLANKHHPGLTTVLVSSEPSHSAQRLMEANISAYLHSSTTRPKQIIEMVLKFLPVGQTT